MIFKTVLNYQYHCFILLIRWWTLDCILTYVYYGHDNISSLLICHYINVDTKTCKFLYDYKLKLHPSKCAYKGFIQAQAMSTHKQMVNLLFSFFWVSINMNNGSYSISSLGTCLFILHTYHFLIIHRNFLPPMMFLILSWPTIVFF